MSAVGFRSDKATNFQILALTLCSLTFIQRVGLLLKLSLENHSHDIRNHHFGMGSKAVRLVLTSKIAGISGCSVSLNMEVS